MNEIVVDIFGYPLAFFSRFPNDNSRVTVYTTAKKLSCQKEPHRSTDNTFHHVPRYKHSGGAVASWLVRLSPDRAVLVRTLARDIVLCSWARHFTLAVSLSTQVYKEVPANLMLEVTLR